MQKILALCLLLVGGAARAQAHDVNAGPIWNQPDAQAKCPNVCRPPEHWNGQWHTTVPGRASVCGCEMDAPPPPPPPPPPPAAHDVDAGRIWNQADAERKCPRVCAPPESWNGQWRTVREGRRSVCSCNYAVPAVDIHGMYEGVHRDWRDSLRIRRNGRFERGNHDGGSWSFDGRVLVLRWDHWGPATLVLQPDGSFFDPQQNFRLVRRNEMPPPQPPINRNPPEMAGEYRGMHPHWQDTVILTADGRYHRGNGDPGSWWFDGANLHLKWDRWGEEVLAYQSDGSFVDPAKGFRLVRAAVVVPPPPPRVMVDAPPPAESGRREFRSRLMRLDRRFYRPGEKPVVFWEGMPETAGAWISIVPRGTADGEWGDWTYTHSASGSFAATHDMPAGEYEVRAYGGAMGPVIDRLFFSIGR